MIIKNSNIRRSIVENRYVIFVIILGIILAFLVIRILNANAKEKFEQKKSETQNTMIVQEKKDTSSQAVITQTEVEKPVQQNNLKIIEEFIGYCNNKEIEKAYGLLSEECQEEVFSSNIQYFKKNYVDKIFQTKKMYETQAWVNGYQTQTYKVKIMEDILSTGKINSSKNNIEDYYTLVTKGDVTKINLNGYIGRQIIEKETVYSGIRVKLLYKDIYSEYETYKIEMENTTTNTILMDTQENVKTMYLESDEQNTYNAHSHEVDKTQLTIEPNQTTVITIPFNKLYSNQAIIRKVVFSDVILNYEEYMTVENKKQYIKRGTISIEI